MEMSVYEMIYEPFGGGVIPTTGQTQKSLQKAVNNTKKSRNKTKPHTNEDSDFKPSSCEEEDSSSEEENDVHFQENYLEPEENSSIAYRNYEAWLASGCKFDCRICQRSFKSIQFLLNHLKNHDLSKQAYLDKYGSFESKYVLFHCKLCNSKISFVGVSISNHLRSSHDLTSSEYFSRYVADSAFEEPVGGSTKDIKSIEWNQCLRHCDLCDKSTTSLKFFQQHYRQTHNLPRGPNADRTKGDIINYHSCLICNAKVHFQMRNVSMHLDNQHGVKLEDYEKEHFETLKEATRGLLSPSV